MKKSLAAMLMATTLLAAPACAKQPAGDAPHNEVSAPATLPAGEVAEGKRFTVLVTGNTKGPDVVLIPGLSTPRDVWGATADKLKDKYRLHIVQIRGFGDAAGVNGEGPVLDAFVKELADYIDDDIINQRHAAPALIGHSMGGLTALLIAEQIPGKVGKVMVVDAVPFIGTLGSPDATVETVRAQADAMRKMMLAAPKAPPQPNDRAAQTAASMVKNEAEQRRAADWIRAADMRVTAQLFYDIMTTDARADLGKISAPVTLLYAQDDSVMPAAAAEAAFVPQYKGVARFTPVMVPDSRHFIMLDQPERFHAEVAKFLKG
ncbi:alpha/beta fold hydrolase [Pseudonocardia sp. TMWB2A]|uniref:alpha/beta fold hydrolase n=1 Tax=Pseudonocardia sp. TMWB2A TaxID=687430 RepID=UPI00307DE61A